MKYLEYFDETFDYLPREASKVPGKHSMKKRAISIGVTEKNLRRLEYDPDRDPKWVDADIVFERYCHSLS